MMTELQITRRRALLLAAAIFLFTVLLPAEPCRADAVEDAGRSFLEALDGEDYDRAWQQLHPDYRALGTQERWAANIAQTRSGLGPCSERKIGIRDIVGELPHLGKGNFLYVRFLSQFEAQARQEVVMFMYLEDEGWRVAGYALR